MTTTSIVPVNNEQFLPAMPLAVAKERRQALVQFVQSIMVDGTDFGKIPGAGDKPTLLKPGAEKLSTFFGLTPVLTPVEAVQDWTGADHNGEPFFYFRYRCELLRNGIILASSEGSCNSWESKYRYRKGERVCPNCGQAAIIKGKAEYGGGWLCFAKRGGCGAKFKDGDPEIEGQPVGRVLNPDPADQVNTIQKMAQKRALIGSTLLAVNASEFFTQDIEDMIDADYTVVAEPPAKSKPAAKPPPEPTTDDDLSLPFPPNVEAAQAWAVEVGASENIHAARSAFRRLVETQFSGKLTKQNAEVVYAAWYDDRQAKLAGKKQDEPHAEPEAVADVQFGAM